MTTKEMMDLPLGARVMTLSNCEIYEKVPHGTRNDYRCSFRRVGPRGLSSKISKFHGKRICLIPAILEPNPAASSEPKPELGRT